MNLFSYIAVINFQAILESAASVLCERELQMSKATSTTSTEKAAFERCVVAFSNDLLPYIDGW